jgi:hypothetical protein
VEQYLCTIKSQVECECQQAIERFRREIQDSEPPAINFGGEPGSADQLPPFLSAKDLARLLGQTPDRVESFLRRYRGSHRGCYILVNAPRKHEPRMLYRTSAVWKVLQHDLSERPKSTDE